MSKITITLRLLRMPLVRLVLFRTIRSPVLRALIVRQLQNEIRKQVGRRLLGR